MNARPVSPTPADRRGPLRSRRQLLFDTALGFGGVALWSLLSSCSPVPPSARARAARGKSVIFLYMEGGPSAIDTFDHKPLLAQRAGEEYSFPDGVQGPLWPSPFSFRPAGGTGTPVADIFPHLAGSIDDIALIHSVTSNQFDHGAANFLMNTGTAMPGRPSMGAWTVYGLGTECDDLPGYIVLGADRIPAGGMDVLGCGFLSAKYQSTVIDPGPLPVANLAPLEPHESLQRAKLDLVAALDRQDAARAAADESLEAVIASHEMAFRMQDSVPQVLDLSRETTATLDLYGIRQHETETFGTQCLRACRLVERGVRFVQLLSPNVPNNDRWDQHGNLDEGHRRNALAVDRPVAGLLRDLQARGLWDSTIVIFGGEFGRLPFGFQALPGVSPGRNHNPRGFTMWLAGGGVRPGIRYGATDEFGYRAVQRPVEVHDVHATVLHLLGIDHEQLTFRHGGRDMRLTDVYGRVIDDLLDDSVRPSSAAPAV